MHSIGPCVLSPHAGDSLTRVQRSLSTASSSDKSSEPEQCHCARRRQHGSTEGDVIESNAARGARRAIKYEAEQSVLTIHRVDGAEVKRAKIPRGGARTERREGRPLGARPPFDPVGCEARRRAANSETHRQVAMHRCIEAKRQRHAVVAIARDRKRFARDVSLQCTEGRTKKRAHPVAERGQIDRTDAGRGSDRPTALTIEQAGTHAFEGAKSVVLSVG